MITYYTTTRIWLSLEQYTNKGLTQEQMKEIISDINDRGSSSSKLRVTESGLNGNLIVETFCVNPDSIDLIVSFIRNKLEDKVKVLCL